MLADYIKQCKCAAEFIIPFAAPDLCPDGRMKPDKWTCQSCRFAEYYSYYQETCVPCPDMTVTRQQKTDMVEESVCVHGKINSCCLKYVVEWQTV